MVCGCVPDGYVCGVDGVEVAGWKKIEFVSCLMPKGVDRWIKYSLVLICKSQCPGYFSALVHGGQVQ
jgi:hypothetical protein